MTIYNIPSPWEIIAQGISGGIKNYQDAKERVRAEAAQNANFIGQLYSQGAVDASALQDPMAKLGLSGIKVQPNKAQLQREVMASPDIKPGTNRPWTDMELSQRGLPTQAGQLGMGQETSIAKIKQKLFDNPSYNPTPREANLAGIPTNEELAAGRAATQDKLLSSVGDKYVDQVLAPVMAANKGKLPAANWRELGDQAYQAYETDRTAQNLPPNPGARPYFYSQVLDRAVQQRKQDIEEIQAGAAGSYRQLAQEDRQFSMYTGVVNERRQIMDGMLKGNPMLGFYLNQPAHAKDPAVVDYKAAQTQMIQAQNAQARLAGINKDLLTIPTTTEPVARLQPAQHQAIASMILGKKGTLTDAANDVRAGRMTTTDYNAIRALVIAGVKK